MLKKFLSVLKYPKSLWDAFRSGPVPFQAGMWMIMGVLVVALLSIC